MREIQDQYAVVVAGGGLAGVCAAIAAAREMDALGLPEGRVALLSDRPMLGGCSSSEICVPPIGAGRHPFGYETGIIHELMLENRIRNHERWENGVASSLWDLILWEAVGREARIDLLLNTTLCGAHMEGTRIRSVEALQSGNETRYALRADLFIDCTGDGTLGAYAGAPYRIGREASSAHGEIFAPNVADEACMGTSLMFRARDLGRDVPFAPPPYAAHYPDEDSLLDRVHTDFRNGYWWIEVGMPYHTIDDNEAIRDELLRHVLGVWDHLKNHCPRFREAARHWALDWFGWVCGKRESRRLMGDHLLTEGDLRGARLFEDRVAYGGHFLDLHTMGGILAAGQPGNPVDSDPVLYDAMRIAPYSIPLRSLYSAAVENLFMAGRCLSATHVAMGSARVMLTGALMGQAVGTAAAHCLARGCTPRDCAKEHIHAVQQSLLQQGCYVPALRNEDPLDLARAAAVTASGDAALAMDAALAGYASMEDPLGLLFPVSGNRLEKVRLHLSTQDGAAIPVRLRLRRARHIWDFRSEADLAVAEALVPPKTEGWVDFAFEADLEPGLYWVAADPAPGAAWGYALDLAPGCVSVWRRPGSSVWHYLNDGYRRGFRMLRAQIAPVSHPYGPENLQSGVTRPEAWTNLWMGTGAGPQWVQYAWPAPQTFARIEITWDDDLSLNNETYEPLTYPKSLVRDYTLSVRCEGAWTQLLSVHGNGQRRRVHRFPAVCADALRVEIESTHGQGPARLVELRVYEKEGAVHAPARR